MKGYLEAADGYSMTEEFLTFVESNSMYCDSLTGTLVVDHSQFKVPEQGNSNEDNDANAGNVSFLYNNNNDYSFIGTVVTSKGAARPGGEAVTSDDEEEEEEENLDAYDYNNDGEMGTDEFQDAVGDYMDSHGY